MQRKVTAYIIGYNEEANLRELLPTITWADEILYIDSHSQDGTAIFCRENNIRHIDVPFEGFGKLRNRALELASNDWIFSIDTDERCTPEFAAELRETLIAPKADAYFVPRLNTFLGKPVRHGGLYPDYRQPQVFDRRKFRYREDIVHEGFECTGNIAYFRNPIWQHPFPTLAVILAKTERYTTLMAERNFAAGHRGTWLRLTLNPLAAFLKKYVLKRGFLDGIAGFMLAALHAYYTFLKHAKLWELEHGITKRNKSSAPR
jgi:glycosyltransferase involved in cell wall biosynthesis